MTFKGDSVVSSGVEISGLGWGVGTFSSFTATAVSILELSNEAGLRGSPSASFEVGTVRELSLAGTAGAPFSYKGLASTEGLF